MRLPDALDRLLLELETFGAAHDERVSDRSQRMLNITRDTGELLVVLVILRRARRILEIGTSNGYSSLWLAHAARLVDGALTTVERSGSKIELAAANFARSGLGDRITQLAEDAERVLERADDRSYDVIFLDSDRSDYPRWWPDVRRILSAGGLLIVDNAISHASEVAPFISLVSADADVATSLVPVGKGEFLAVKTR